VVPWLKVRVLIRAALTMSWPSETWPEVRAGLPWLLAEERRLRRHGWLNSRFASMPNPDRILALADLAKPRTSAELTAWVDETCRGIAGVEATKEPALMPSRRDLPIDRKRTGAA
jgi:hypothetical protein